MKPYIVMCNSTDATICAATVEDAIKYARNYFGDSRTDYRNHNRIEFLRSEQIGDDTFYHFTINS